MYCLAHIQNWIEDNTKSKVRRYRDIVSARIESVVRSSDYQQILSCVYPNSTETSCNVRNGLSVVCASRDSHIILQGCELAATEKIHFVCEGQSEKRHRVEKPKNESEKRVLEQFEHLYSAKDESLKERTEDTSEVLRSPQGLFEERTTEWSDKYLPETAHNSTADFQEHHSLEELQRGTIERCLSPPYSQQEPWTSDDSFSSSFEGNSDIHSETAELESLELRKVIEKQNFNIDRTNSAEGPAPSENNLTDLACSIDDWHPPVEHSNGEEETQSSQKASAGANRVAQLPAEQNQERESIRVVEAPKADLSLTERFARFEAFSAVEDGPLCQKKTATRGAVIQSALPQVSKLVSEASGLVRNLQVTGEAKDQPRSDCPLKELVEQKPGGKTYTLQADTAESIEIKTETEISTNHKDSVLESAKNEIAIDRSSFANRRSVFEISAAVVPAPTPVKATRKPVSFATNNDNIPASESPAASTNRPPIMERSGGSTLLQQYIAPRAKLIDETKETKSSFSSKLAVFSNTPNDSLDQRNADREKPGQQRSKNENLSKSDRAVTKQSQGILITPNTNPGHAADTFDFDTLVFPVSDTAALQQFKQMEMLKTLNNQQVADTLQPHPVTEPINKAYIPDATTWGTGAANSTTAITSSKPQSSHKSNPENAKKMVEIINLSKRAIEADEKGLLEEAYQLYKQSVDLSMNLIPSLDEAKQEKLHMQINVFLDRMERVTKEMLNQSSIAVSSEVLLDESQEFLDSENDSLRANKLQKEASHREWMMKSQESLTKLSSARGKGKDRARSTVTLDHKSYHNSSIPLPTAADNVNAGSNRHLSVTNSKSKEEFDHMREELEMMKERLQGFILGGDASGRRGQTNAFALNNMITNLNASVFGEFKRLAPISENRERYWNQQIQILVYGTLESIVEKQPRKKTLSNGTVIEEQVDVPREDIAHTLPVLQSADLEIRRMCSEFKILEGVVQYEKNGGNSQQSEAQTSILGEQPLNKWWIETPRVPKGGLDSYLRDQVLYWRKRAAALQMECRNINCDVLQAMPVPQSYVETLPLHVKDVLGEQLVRELTMPNNFSIEKYMKSMNWWDVQHAGMMASKLEKAVIIWSRRIAVEKRHHGGDSHERFGLKKLFDRVKRADTSSTLQKMVAVNQKAEHALRTLRDAFPFMSHTEVDMIKMQQTHDVGSAGLEAFSRALEARAAKIKDRLDDLIQADEAERKSNGQQRLLR